MNVFSHIWLVNTYVCCTNNAFYGTGTGTVFLLRVPAVPGAQLLHRFEKIPTNFRQSESHYKNRLARRLEEKGGGNLTDLSTSTGWQGPLGD
jgi:hypothetical protein